MVAPSSEAAARTGRLLCVLLGERVEYRRMWEGHAQRRVSAGEVSQAAVSRVIVEHLWREGEASDDASARSVRHRIRRALSGERCSTQTLRWIVAAFAMGDADTSDLFRALAGESGRLPAVGAASFPVLPMSRHRTRSLHELHILGPDRIPERHRTVQVIEALVDGYNSYPYRFDTPDVTVTVNQGGHAGPVLPVAPDLWGVSIGLDPPMRRGETRSLVYDTSYSYREPPPPEFRRGARGRVEAVNIRVEFDRGAMPAAVSWCTWSDGDAPMTEESAMLDARGGVERFISFLDGTLVGFRWSWA